MNLYVICSPKFWISVWNWDFMSCFITWIVGGKNGDEWLIGMRIMWECWKWSLGEHIGLWNCKVVQIRKGSREKIGKFQKEELSTLFELRQKPVLSSAHGSTREDQATAWRRGRPEAMPARASFGPLVRASLCLARNWPETLLTGASLDLARSPLG